MLLELINIAIKVPTLNVQRYQQFNMTFDCRFRKSGVLVEMSRLAFHFEARRGLTEAERDHLKNYLYGRVSGQVCDKVA